MAWIILEKNLATAFWQSFRMHEILEVSQAVAVSQNWKKKRISRPNAITTDSTHTWCSSFFFLRGHLKSANASEWMNEWMNEWVKNDYRRHFKII